MSDTSSTYEGDWVDGDGVCNGKKTYADGSIYEGETIDCEPHGKGKMTYPDGGASSGCAVEEGTWDDKNDVFTAKLCEIRAENNSEK